jgi:hypothetical protein
MWKKLALIAILLISFLLPFLAYSAEKNPTGHAYTLSFPSAERNPCNDVCKTSYFETILPNGQRSTTAVLCAVRVDESGWGMAGHSVITGHRKYCILRTITKTGSETRIEETIVKELEE